MNGREKFSRALRREPITGHVPHFELVFYLTMEELGKVHPSHRRFSQWQQMSARERRLQLEDAAYCFTETARRYNHSAIFVHPSVHEIDAVRELLEIIRETTGDEFFIMMHGDSTFSIPNGDEMMEFSVSMYDRPEAVKEEAERNLEQALEWARHFAGKNILDGFALCADYCFNVNPFFTNEQFYEFIVPYLKRLIAGYREMGFYSIKHTDGNIMPILDAMLECKPDALHSLDPQGGVDLKYLKDYCGDQVCLIGNVNCGLLQTGTDEEVTADVLRALHDGMPGYGYIFSTSNCVYTGLPLERYKLMHGLWREHGVYV
jgi:uroporphyrinogen decarboxylase